ALQLPRRDSVVRVLPEHRPELSAVVAGWRQLSESVTALAEQWRTRSGELREILLGSGKLNRLKNHYRQSELQPTLEEIDEWFRRARELPMPPCFTLIGATRISAAQLPTRPGDPRREAPFVTACDARPDGA